MICCVSCIFIWHRFEQLTITDWNFYQRCALYSPIKWKLLLLLWFPLHPQATETNFKHKHTLKPGSACPCNRKHRLTFCCQPFRAHNQSWIAALPSVLSHNWRMNGVTSRYIVRRRSTMDRISLEILLAGDSHPSTWRRCTNSRIACVPIGSKNNTRLTVKFAINEVQFVFETKCYPSVFQCRLSGAKLQIMNWQSKYFHFSVTSLPLIFHTKNSLWLGSGNFRLTFTRVTKTWYFDFWRTSPFCV